MRALVVYGSTDGQTRKISRFAADWLFDHGHMVEVLPAKGAGDADLTRFDTVILAGSIHAGGYQKALRKFAKAHAVALGDVPTLFLSVSLSAAGDDPDDWSGVRKCVEAFIDKTGWTPDRIEHVAGAFRFTKYDFFRAWAMKRIAEQKGDEVDPHADKEYTDWEALQATLAEWVKAVEKSVKA